ncbi:MAG: PqqD family protein [Vicinamibacteria bacterium]
MPSKKITVPERRNDLIVQSLGDETIVYDRASHRAHSLNRTAALVFEKLDGKHDRVGIATHMTKTLGKTAQPALVDAALNELAAAGLLQPEFAASLPRRSVLKGLAVGLLPVVASISVPSAAAAASCAPLYGACTYTSDCCYGLSCIQTGTSTFECL